MNLATIETNDNTVGYFANDVIKELFTRMLIDGDCFDENTSSFLLFNDIFENNRKNENDGNFLNISLPLAAIFARDYLHPCVVDDDNDSECATCDNFDECDHKKLYGEDLIIHTIETSIDLSEKAFAMIETSKAINGENSDFGICLGCIKRIIDQLCWKIMCICTSSYADNDYENFEDNDPLNANITIEFTEVSRNILSEEDRKMKMNELINKIDPNRFLN